jgi:hypothetical protein
MKCLWTTFPFTLVLLVMKSGVLIIEYQHFGECYASSFLLKMNSTLLRNIARIPDLKSATVCVSVQKLLLSFEYKSAESPMQCNFCLIISWPVSSVGIATGYGLDGPGIEARWGRGFSHTSRPALGPTQPPVRWVPDLSRG